MNAISLLTDRQSNPSLTNPAPNAEQLDIILKAGMRAPDHGALSPWHFTIAEGEGLNKLSDIFFGAASDLGWEEAKLEKAKKMPFRAPMIIIISTKYQNHPKVPESEQLVAAGCAAHAMQMAAYAQGLGGMWRTGDFSYDDNVKAALGVSSQDEIVGFLYLGTESKQLPKKPSKAYDTFVNYLR